MHNVIQNCRVDVEQEAEPHRAYYITPQGSEVCRDSQAWSRQLLSSSNSRYFFTPCHYQTRFSTLTLSHRLLINVLHRFPTLLTQLSFLLHTLTSEKKLQMRSFLRASRPSGSPVEAYGCHPAYSWSPWRLAQQHRPRGWQPTISKRLRKGLIFYWENTQAISITKARLLFLWSM